MRLAKGLGSRVVNEKDAVQPIQSGSQQAYFIDSFRSRRFFAPEKEFCQLVLKTTEVYV
jgi:hypothetical protein